MTFTQPLAWGLLLLSIPIVLLFFLKIRFRKEIVTTSFFWQQVLEERRMRNLFRRFRHFLSLMLALLFIVFITVAALDPVRTSERNHRQIIIIDHSASMNVLMPSSKTSRLDVAKQEALKRLDTTAAGEQVAIIAASVDPKIVSGFTDRLSLLRRKLSAIAPTDLPDNWTTVLQQIEQLAADQPDIPIYVYSDKENLPVPLKGEGMSFHFMSVGEGMSDNCAITQFQIRRLPEHDADAEMLIEAVNFGTETVSTRLEIDCDGKIADVIPLTLEPNKPVTKIVRHTSYEGGLYRATLSHTDSFPKDHVAIAFLSKLYVQRILFFGTENYFLLHALQALPQTEIIWTEEVPDVVPPESVLICHQTVPIALPKGNVIIIDPQNDSDRFHVGERLEEPLAAKINTESSLVRFISTGLIFASAKQITFANHDTHAHDVHVLAETAEGVPLYTQWIADDQQTLVLSADLNQGDLALRTAFPILISQALSHFRSSTSWIKAYSTAEPVELTTTTKTEKDRIILRSPSGKERIVPCSEGKLSLGRLEECGIWTILEPDTNKELDRVACNLFHAAESNVHSMISKEQTESLRAEKSQLSSRTIGFYCMILLLLLSLTEWFLYQRRWIE